MGGLLFQLLMVLAIVAGLAVVIPIGLALVFMVMDMLKSSKNPKSRFGKFL